MIGMGMEFWGMGFFRKTYENSRTTKKRMRVEAQYRACDETLIIYTTYTGIRLFVRPSVCPHVRPYVRPSTYKIKFLSKRWRGF